MIKIIFLVTVSLHTTAFCNGLVIIDEPSTVLPILQLPMFDDKQAVLAENQRQALIAAHFSFTGLQNQDAANKLLICAEMTRKQQFRNEIDDLMFDRKRLFQLLRQPLNPSAQELGELKNKLVSLEARLKYLWQQQVLLLPHEYTTANFKLKASWRIQELDQSLEGDYWQAQLNFDNVAFYDSWKSLSDDERQLLSNGPPISRFFYQTEYFYVGVYNSSDYYTFVSIDWFSTATGQLFRKQREINFNKSVSLIEACELVNHLVIGVKQTIHTKHYFQRESIESSQIIYLKLTGGEL